MDVVELMNDTSTAIDGVINKYNARLNMVSGYLTKISSLPDLVETKSIEFIEEQQYKLTKKVVAILQEGEQFLAKQIQTLQNKATAEMERLANNELERKIQEELDKLMASATMEKCTNALAIAATWAEKKAKKAQEEIEKAKKITEATQNLMESIKNAKVAAENTKKLIVTEIPGTIEALTDLQTLINIKDAALTSVNNTKNSLTSSIRSGLTNIQSTTMQAAQSITDGGMKLLYKKLNDLSGGLGDITNLITANTDKLSAIPGLGDNVLGLNSGAEWVNDKLSGYVKQGSDYASGMLNKGVNSITNTLDSLTENETFQGWEKVIEDELNKPINDAMREVNKATAGVYDTLYATEKVADEVINDDNLMDIFEK